MKHEKTIFLENCKKELENNRQEINMVSLMNMILIKGGDVQTPVDMERVIETVGKLSNLYGESKNMVEFLVNNYTKQN